MMLYIYFFFSLRRFFRGANFAGWYNARYKEVVQKLQGLHIQAISDAVSFILKFYIIGILRTLYAE